MIKLKGKNANFKGSNCEKKPIKKWKKTQLWMIKLKKNARKQKKNKKKVKKA